LSAHAGFPEELLEMGLHRRTRQAKHRSNGIHSTPGLDKCGQNSRLCRRQTVVVRGRSDSGLENRPCLRHGPTRRFCRPFAARLRRARVKWACCDLTEGV
jgi:hypothetical protein